MDPQTDSSPLPGVDERSAPFWAALARGEIVLQRCAVCGTLSHPAAELCRACESSRLEWSPVAPAARLFSWAVEHRSVIAGMRPPYVIAQVTPEGVEAGGVRLMCNLLVDDIGSLSIDMPLRLVAAPVPGSDSAVLHALPV